MSVPRAIMQAPVKVARSTICTQTSLLCYLSQNPQLAEMNKNQLRQEGTKEIYYGLDLCEKRSEQDKPYQL
jgi:hypothetical protein